MTRLDFRQGYAKTTHGQPNANLAGANNRNDWIYWNKSSASDSSIQPSGSAESFYWISPGVGKETLKPWTFAGNDFDLNIPDCAYITKVTFTVEMKITGKITVNAPRGRFNMYGGTKSVSNTIKNDTGWKDGYYYIKPSQKLSSSWQKISYVMSGAEFHKRGYTINTLRDNRLGIDLAWYDPTKTNKSAHYVSIKYVHIRVDYELPDQQITFDKVTGIDTPYIMNSGDTVRLTAKYANKSNAGCCSSSESQVKVDIPPNANVRLVNGDYANGIWTVPCTPNSSANLVLDITDYGIGEKPVIFSNSNIANPTFYYYCTPVKNDVGEVTPYPDTIMQKGIRSCVTFKGKVQASDGEATFDVNMDTVNNSNPSVVWSIVEEESDTDVSLKTESCTDSRFVLNVPTGGNIVEFTVKGCFIPKVVGVTNVSVSLDGSEPVTASYDVINAPVFIVRNEPKTSATDRDTAEIVFNPSLINFITHRIASSTELGAYAINCGVASFDSVMTDEPCTLTADVWDKIDYIGCVPLEYHHYDPDSTYSNKAISESYKNKTYKGKEGEIEEKISLKFKARPKQVPTLQGLTKMDKPTPINANHKCFEGDPLNHRGWVVLSEIKATRTNPLWYDVEAEVDYITHDINTKFQIFKENAVVDKPMPEILTTLFDLGDSLSDRLDLFNVDTDGGYIYDEGADVGTRNMFSLDEGQVLSIATRDFLAPVSNIRFDWYSNTITEHRENNLSRVFELVNENGESVLQYEYTNFQFYDDYVACDTIIRVMTEDGWDSPITNTIDLRTEVEEEEIIDTYSVEPDEEDVNELDSNNIDASYTDETDEEDEDAEPDEEDNLVYDVETGTWIPVVDDDPTPEDSYDEGYIAPEFDISEYNISQTYGTSLHFNLNGNLLTIIDEGYNGREYSNEGKAINLLEGKYYFRTKWVNNNTDAMTGDVISFLDIELDETIYDTRYAEQYQNLMVSPFPIPHKDVVFTRKSEEGTIYYLTGNEPFKYLIEPYYQYHCGCDLLGEETSVFDLNNSYTHYYIENGLVRLGFNKYNGRLYLAKYDAVSGEWITTHYFHLVNEPKFAIQGSISDDKIVIKAGNDTFFTIWRGRPYIGVINPTDVIYIDSKFGYCLCDEVEEKPTSEGYPKIYSFMNTDNLLPSGVGGNYLDYDDILVDDDVDEIITTDHDITLTIPDNIDAYNNVTFISNITPATIDGKVHLFVNGNDVAQATAPFNLDYVFQEEGTYKVYAVYIGDDDDNVAISPVYDIVIETPKTEDDPQGTLGTYKLEIISAPKKFTYRDNGKVVLQLTRNNEGKSGLPVELVYPNGHTITKNTGTNGILEIVNNNTDFTPGNHQWGGRFYDPNDEDADRKLIYSALKWIKIEKATPTFTHNASSGKLNKGTNFVVKLNGVDSKADSNKAGLKGKKITYKVNGKKATQTTSKNGKISIKLTKSGTNTVVLTFAGSVRYNGLKKSFNIKVK